MELKGSQTEKNLMAAFAGECQARVKYEFYSSKAKKDGYQQISAIFDETSHNEKEHAKIWFKQLHNGTVPSTVENLQDAANGENYEYTVMYKDFAKVAKEEGFEDIARLFEEVAIIEKRHDERFLTFIENIKEDLVFRRSDDELVWICRNCGHVHVGPEAPEECPVCAHPQAYFELMAENY